MARRTPRTGRDRMPSGWCGIEAGGRRRAAAHLTSAAERLLGFLGREQADRFHVVDVRLVGFAGELALRGEVLPGADREAPELVALLLRPVDHLDARGAAAGFVTLHHLLVLDVGVATKVVVGGVVPDL